MISCVYQNLRARKKKLSKINVSDLHSARQVLRFNEDYQIYYIHSISKAGLIRTYHLLFVAALDAQRWNVKLMLTRRRMRYNAKKLREKISLNLIRSNL